jgi:aminopeptidase N
MRSLLIVLALAAVSSAQELKFAADRPIDIKHIHLKATVDLEKKRLECRATLFLTAERKLSTITLDAVGMEIKSVEYLPGRPAQPAKASFQNDGERLRVFLEQPLRAGTPAEIRIDYVVTDPERGLVFYGPTEAEPNVPYQVWSQGEAVDNRHWIPCADQPNERLTSELVITTKSDLDVLSNGKFVSRTDHGNGTATFHWAQRKDHVPYLISLVVGKFAKVEEKWRGKPVRYWVPPHRRKDVPRSFGNTLRMLDFFSDSIGVEFPWDQYAQVVVEQFSFGGMENTSATTLNERTLHDARAHLDYSSDGLVAHELAHQWFGDLLTCTDWAHIWLNEGFATYFEALWNENDQGRDAFLTNMQGKARGAISGGKKWPIVYRAYRRPFQQFDARAYPKGAWVLHMIRSRLGDDLWWKCIQAYVERYQHMSVETVDLRKTIEEVTGRSFERFFHDWTGRRGNPVVTVKTDWRGADKLAEIEVSQTQKDAAFHFPLEIEFRFAKGLKPLRITHRMKTKRDRFFVPLPARPSMVRVDPRYTVLMELTEKKGRDLWLAQLTDDPNPILRGRAAAHFGKSRRDPDRTALGQALSLERFWGAQIEIAKALGASGGTISRDTLLNALSLAHPKSRKAVVEALGRFREDDTVEDALLALVKNGDASYYVEAAAIDAWAKYHQPGAREVLEPLLERNSHNEVVRQAALRGIGEQQDPASVQVLIAWTKRGKPRTCRAAALEALGKVARGGGLDEATVKMLADTCIGCLHRREPRRLKSAASQTLRDLGASASHALPALEALAAHDRNDKVRKQAQDAIDKISAGAPARLELKRLRDELKKLSQANQTLSGRLEKLEHKQPAPVEGKAREAG